MQESYMTREKDTARKESSHYRRLIRAGILAPPSQESRDRSITVLLLEGYAALRAYFRGEISRHTWEEKIRTLKLEYIGAMERESNRFLEDAKRELDRLASVNLSGGC